MGLQLFSGALKSWLTCLQVNFVYRTIEELVWADCPGPVPTPVLYKLIILSYLSKP